MTYSQFKALVQAYIHQEGNPKVSAQVDNFISLGESVINRRVRTQQMLQTVLLSDLEVGDPPTYPIPEDYLEVYGIWDGDVSVQFATVHELRKLGLRETSSLTSCPIYYSILGGFLVFSKAPGAEATLTYYAKPPALAGIAGEITAPLFVRHQDLYLYSAMAEAAPFLRDEEGGQYWQQNRERIFQEIRLENWDARVPKAQPLRVR